MKIIAKLFGVGMAAALMVSAFNARADEASVSEVRQYLEQNYGTLQNGPVPTGILYDLALPLSRISDFNGGSNSKPATFEEWLQVGFELRKSALVETGLPEHTVFREMGRADNRQHRSSLGILNYRFNRLRPGIPLDSAIHAEGGRITWIDPSAFVEERVFAISPLHPKTYRGEEVRFHMDLSSLYFSNDPHPLRKVEVDFDDGLGFRSVPPEGDVTVHYVTTGQKQIRIRAEQSDGSQLTAATTFEVVVLMTPNVSDTLEVQATIPYEGGYATGQAYVYLADGHSTISRPVVVSEGFDLANDMNWDELYALLNQQNLIETMRAAGYDAVVLNYTNAIDYIQRNGFLMETLLEQVSQIAGPDQSIALVGPSMGGLTTRFALDYMETNGIPHHVRTLVTFDAPNRGANIPLGLQYWVDFFAANSADAAFLRDALNSPAAREMLVAHYTIPPSNVAGSDPLRAVLVSDFAAVGDYPSQPRKVAVANGSGYGAGQGFNPGDQLIHYEYNNLLITITGNVWSLNNMATQQVFQGRYRIWPIVDDQENVSVAPTWPWDNAPGGYRNSMAQMDTVAVPYGDIQALHPNHCFIPTISSLDLNTPDPFFDIANAPDLYSLTPFDSVYFPAENQDHVTITPQNVWWFINEIIDSLPAPVVVIQSNGTDTRLNWTRTAGAQSYRVYSTPDFENWPAQFAATTDTMWVDPENAPLLKFYRVLASTAPVQSR